MNSRLLWFALGAAALWTFDHFFNVPRAPMGKHKGAG